MKNLSLVLFTGLISIQALGEGLSYQNKTSISTKKSTSVQQILAKGLGDKSLLLRPSSMTKTDSQILLIQELLKKEKIITAIGGGDAGGGNLLNGRPIESYTIDVKNTPEMKKALAVITPLMDVRFNSLRSELDFVVNKKTWYLVPVSLPTIPSSDLGVSFPTEQGALQDFEEIWLDQNLFSKMAFNDRVLLLVHELYMGMKVINFESYFQQCAINKPFNDDCLKYKSSQDRKLLNVSADDYQDVRHATTVVSKNFSILESGNYWDVIESMRQEIYDGGGFDSDFVRPSFASLELKDFTDLDVINALKNQKSVKGFPKYCNHQIVEDLGNHNYRMRAKLQTETTLNVLNNNSVTLNVRSTELETGKVTINNAYNYSIPENSKHQLSLAFVLNTPVYVMNYFVGVSPVNGDAPAMGGIAIGIDSDLNVNSLAFATLDNDISGVMTGKDALRCLDKIEFICSGVDCTK